MPDYQNGKIYTIRCRTDDTKIYVGSTTTTLSQRITQHRSASKKETKTQWYNNVEDWKDWYIELYENCPCDKKEQLLKREGEIIREIGDLKYQIAGRTSKEWSNENPEKKQASCKKYYEKHHEERLLYKKAYRKANKEKIAEYKANYWLNVEVQNKDEVNRKQKENREKRKASE